MKKPNNQATGKHGEDIATKYLISKGYSIIEKNYQEGYSEIDLVARENDTIVFVEVKTRRGNSYGSGIESVTHSKIRSLVRSASYYMTIKEKKFDSFRIDVLGISLDDGGQLDSIEHIKNITMDI